MSVHNRLQRRSASATCMESVMMRKTDDPSEASPEDSEVHVVGEHDLKPPDFR